MTDVTAPDIRHPGTPLPTLRLVAIFGSLAAAALIVLAFGSNLVLGLVVLALAPMIPLGLVVAADRVFGH